MRFTVPNGNETVLTGKSQAPSDDNGDLDILKAETIKFHMNLTICSQTLEYGVVSE